VADFLVSPARETGWRVDAEEFELRLRAAAQNVQIWRSDDPASLSALRFNVPFGDENELDGWLMRDGQVLELSGGLEESAVIAAWMRTLAPADEDLLFWDEGAHFIVRVTSGLSHHAILDAAEAALVG
jgi:hypothetical protein